MIVPEAAYMPPNWWKTEILASGIWAEAMPRIWRTDGLSPASAIAFNAASPCNWACGMLWMSPSPCGFGGADYGGRFRAICQRQVAAINTAGSGNE
jgi:hypothetical protein